MIEDNAVRFNALCASLSAIDRGSMRTKNGEGRETTEESRRDFVQQLRDIVAGSPLVDAEAMQAEIDQRRLKL